MKRVLLAETAVLHERKLLFHLLLVPLRIRRDARAFGTLHFRHVVLDLPHNRFKKITFLLYGKNRIPSILSR